MGYWLEIVGLWLARLGGWSPSQLTDPFQRDLWARDRTIATLNERVADLKTTLAARDQDIWRLEGEINRWRISPEILERAAALIRDADTLLTGSEAKRHMVYAKLLKDFPEIPKRNLALAIELALPPKEG